MGVDIHHKKFCQITRADYDTVYNEMYEDNRLIVETFYATDTSKCELIIPPWEQVERLNQADESVVVESLASQGVHWSPENVAYSGERLINTLASWKSARRFSDFFIHNFGADKDIFRDSLSDVTAMEDGEYIFGCRGALSALILPIDFPVSFRVDGGERDHLQAWMENTETGEVLWDETSSFHSFLRPLFDRPMLSAVAVASWIQDITSSYNCQQDCRRIYDMVGKQMALRERIVKDNTERQEDTEGNTCYVNSSGIPVADSALEEHDRLDEQILHISKKRRNKENVPLWILAELQYFIDEAWEKGYAVAFSG